MNERTEEAGARANSPRRVWAANRLGLDYRAEAGGLGPPPTPIIDAHTHVNGGRAAEVFWEAAHLYGVRETWSQTRGEVAAEVAEATERCGGGLRFIAIPNFMDADRTFAHTTGFLERVRWWRGEHDARIVKFWNAPRLLDFGGPGAAEFRSVDSPWRVRIAEEAVKLGMMFMTHVGDPDTWFATKYADAGVYGTKRSQYEPLERMLARFSDTPWIAAHMGGWPEDPGFLDGMLSRHGNLYIDTSATKWMVRELSRRPRAELVGFLERWRGRVLFGSDIVTSDDHLTSAPVDGDNAIRRAMAEQAGSREEAFELYASRYWCLRTLWETTYSGESPIADPDLAMVEPGRFDAMSAPRLEGRSLGESLLRELYEGAARRLWSEWTSGAWRSASSER